MIYKFSYIPLHEQILDRLKAWAKAGGYCLQHQRVNADVWKKTAAFRGIHKGQGAFVLGCGPSLNKFDLRKFARYQKENQFFHNDGLYSQ